MIHTGLSLKEETWIVARPWTDFFLSWTSTKSASPSVSGKLKTHASVRFFYHSKHNSHLRGDLSFTQPRYVLTLRPHCRISRMDLSMIWAHIALAFIAYEL